MSNTVKCLAGLTGMILLATADRSLAEISAGTINKNQQDTREYYELLRKQRDNKLSPPDEKVVEQTPEPVQQETATSSRTIWIDRFEVSASKVLSEELIVSVTDRYVKQSLNIKQLLAVVNEINHLYKAHSTIIARAVLPKQTVTDGVITIQLIEAELGAVKIEGNQYTRESFIQNRLSLAEGELIDTRQLEQDLIAFNRWNGMTLKASLMPGEQYGTTNIILMARESEQFKLNVFTDNSGRETVGEYRTGIAAQLASVFGFRDRLSFNGTRSEGATNLRAAYNIPVHRSGTRLGLSYDYGNIEIIDGPLTRLNVTGKSKNLGITFAQPIATGRRYDWDASLGYIDKTSDSFFDKVNLVSTTAKNIVLGTNFRLFDKSGTWQTSHSITLGDSESVKGRDYMLYNGSLVRLSRFANGGNLLFRSRWQLADTHDLPSFDQLVIGGVASVRGYTEGLLSGDDGYSLNAEYSHPFDWLSSKGRYAKLFAFVDHGAAFPYRGNKGKRITAKDFLASAGVGLDVDLYKGVSFKFSVSTPLLNKTFYDQDSYTVNAVLNWEAW